MSYDIQPFGSIFLNNNEDNEVTKHAPGAIPRMNDVKKKKRRRNAKKARRRAQAEAERREYDTWVVAMYKKNKEEQILKEKEEGLRNLIEQSVSDSNSQFNNSKYNNPIPPPQRPRNSKFMSGKSVISKGRIERTRDPNIVPSDNKTVKTSPIIKNNRKKKQSETRNTENVQQKEEEKDETKNNKNNSTVKQTTPTKSPTKRKKINKNNANKKSHRGLPFSKAKEFAKETLADEVTQLKNKYNQLKLKRWQLTKVLNKKFDHFRANLKIEHKGIQYEELSYDDALSPKATVSRMLHELLIKRVRKFLYSFHQGTPPITILDDILNDVVGHSHLHMETPKKFNDLLFSGMSMKEIVTRKCRECLAILSANSQRWESQIHYILEREGVFKSRMSKQIEDFNHHIAKNKEDIKITKATYWDIMKQFDHLKIEDAKLQKIIVKNRKKHRLLEERLLAEVEDSALWTAEIQRMANRRDRVAQMFRDDLQAKQMAKEAKEQEVKQMLLKAKKEAEEKRLKPYKDAAMNIFQATGVSDVEKILESFENQEGRFQNLNNLIEQKEQQLEQFHQEVSRLKRLLEQSKLISGGGVSTSDEKRLGIDIYNSKLKEAIDEANHAKMRAHTKFVTKRDGLIGLTACAKRIGVKVPSVQLDEDPLTKFVMPRRKRRSSIINRSPARSSAADINRLKKEKNQIEEILEKIEDKMFQILSDVIKNIKAAQEEENIPDYKDTESEGIINIIIPSSTAPTPTQVSKQPSKSNSKASSKAPSRSGSMSLKKMNDENVDSQNTKENGDDEFNTTRSNKNIVSTADLQLIYKSMKLLPERNSGLNIRIKKRNAIVTEYMDATGKMQYAYTYLSDDDDDEEEDDENDHLEGVDINNDFNDDEMDNDSQQQNEIKKMHEKNQHLLHKDIPDDLNTEWEKTRKASRSHSQSIVKVYSGRRNSFKKRKKEVDEDASNLISFSEVLDHEFKNLNSEANYTKHALNYEDEVTSMSKVARRQSGRWRKKIEKQKNLEKLTSSVKHHSRSIRNRYNNDS